MEGRSGEYAFAGVAQHLQRKIDWLRVRNASDRRPRCARFDHTLWISASSRQPVAPAMQAASKARPRNSALPGRAPALRRVPQETSAGEIRAAISGNALATQIASAASDARCSLAVVVLAQVEMGRAKPPI